MRTQEIEYSLGGVKSDRMSLELQFVMVFISKQIPAKIIELKKQ